MTKKADKAERLDKLFGALADESRLRVIKLLEGGELCVCQITAALEMSQPKASFHLKVLREAGLIAHRKAGRWGHYRLQESDALRRFLIFTVMERLPVSLARDDLRRLQSFAALKSS